MNELKPCPFCGSKEVRLVDGDEYSWCMNPTCAIYDYEIRISEWNNRAESIELTTLREQVKVLRKALGKIAILSDEAVTLKIADAALEHTKPKEGE